MRRLLNILLLTLSTLTLTHAQGAAGHVKGEVWFRPFIDRENAFDNLTLPNCGIQFRSKGFQKMIVSDGKGYFEADLPAGIYSVTTTCTMTPDASEYYSAVRADFEVKANSSSLVNLMALLKRTVRKPAGGISQPEYRSPDLNKEILEAKTSTGQSRRVLVRYTRRYASKELAEYQGKRDYRQDAPVSFTYDLLAIYADSISVEKPQMHVRAVGHVVVEDGKQRRQGAEATVEFDAADPIATLKIAK